MKKTLLRTVTLLCISALLLCLCSCSPSRKLHASARADRAVVETGGIEIPYENLYYIAMQRIAELKATHGDAALSDAALVAELETFVWESLLTEREALLSLAADYGIAVDSGDIAERVQAEMDRLLEESFENDRDAYTESLNSAYLTDHYVRTYIAVEDYLADAVLLEMISRGDIDGSDETARTHIWGDGMIRVRQVLIESRNYKDAETALARAKELRDKVADASTDSARVLAMNDAMVYSTGMDVDGNGTYFARGEMTADYEEEAFALPLYGVSEVLTVDGGYCFLLRLPKDEAYMTENFEQLKQKTYYITLNGKLEQRLAAMTLEKTRFGESLDLTDLPVIDADGGEVGYVLGIVGIVVGSVAVAVVAVVLILRKRAACARKGSSKKHASNRKKKR